eukprot:scaffold42535_cov61-Phaeocystis_antarctica.AAC.2
MAVVQELHRKNNGPNSTPSSNGFIFSVVSLRVSSSSTEVAPATQATTAMVTSPQLGRITPATSHDACIHPSKTIIQSCLAMSRTMLSGRSPGSSTATCALATWSRNTHAKKPTASDEQLAK